MNANAADLAQHAAEERAAGRVAAAEILESAAEFMARKWPHGERVPDPPWTPKPTEPTPATGIERSTPRGDE